MSLTAVRQRANVSPAQTMLARDGKTLCFRFQHPDWTSSPSAEIGEAESSAAFDSSWRQECGGYGLGGAGLMLRRCLCVEGWAFQKRVSKFRFGLFYV